MCCVYLSGFTTGQAEVDGLLGCQKFMCQEFRKRESCLPNLSFSDENRRISKHVFYLTHANGTET